MNEDSLGTYGWYVVIFLLGILIAYSFGWVMWIALALLFVAPVVTYNTTGKNMVATMCVALIAFCFLVGAAIGGGYPRIFFGWLGRLIS